MDSLHHNNDNDGSNNVNKLSATESADQSAGDTSTVAMDPDAEESMDITGDLVNQFLSLGTTDREELVRQLQKLVEPSNLPVNAAQFFLDMNNW